MKVEYYPKDYRPDEELHHEILYLFTLLHVLENVDRLTLQIVQGTRLHFPGLDTYAWGAYHGESNTICLPTEWSEIAPVPKEDWDAYVLWNLQHEFVHAIRERDGRDTGHRGFENEMKGLYNRLLKET